MFYSRLLMLKESFPEEFLEKADQYFASLSSEARKNVSISRVAVHLNCSYEKSADFLAACARNGFLKKYFVLCCPECGHIIKRISSVGDIKNVEYCARCDEEIPKDDFDRAQDIEVRFEILEDAPFAEGQHRADSLIKRESADAVQPDSLQFAWDHGVVELKDFYSPEPDCVSALLERANSIDSRQYANRTEQGTFLEQLMVDIFNQCTCFSATREFETKLNQIDGFVVVKRYLKGGFFDGIGSYFYVECKNENSTPKNEYISKLSDIMSRNGCSFGVFVSKKPAPDTFPQICHDIFLSRQQVIICVLMQEIVELLSHNGSFMDFLQRKYIEVRTNATRNLCDLHVLGG